MSASAEVGQRTGVDRNRGSALWPIFCRPAPMVKTPSERGPEFFLFCRAHAPGLLSAIWFSRKGAPEQKVPTLECRRSLQASRESLARGRPSSPGGRLVFASPTLFAAQKPQKPIPCTNRFRGGGGGGCPNKGPPP